MSDPSSSTAPSQNDENTHVLPPETSQEPQATTGLPDRTQLMQTARSFLNSPHVRHESLQAKRDFLVQKGLTSGEIEQLLQTTPAQAPLVPPRTYPQPPPSNLPNLLLGLFRIATWIAGGSAAIILAYFRFIYPRIAQSFQARNAIRNHQRDLLQRLTSSLESTKAEQTSTFALLPTPEPHKEDPIYAEYKTLKDVPVSAKEPRSVPNVTVLRCAIADLEASKQPTTAAAIFSLLEEKMPWSSPEEVADAESRLWETLSSSPLFSESQPSPDNATAVWSYQPPSPPSPQPLFSSLSTLKDALPSSPTSSRSKYQNTLQTLTDLTGYIATQTYALPVAGVKYTPTGIVSTLSPEEEEIRREIRALKGLVLNRRSFMPPRPPSVSSSSPAV